jgi:hypothetical protein
VKIRNVSPCVFVSLHERGELAMNDELLETLPQTMSTIFVEIGALRWSVVRLAAALQQKGALSEVEIANCLDSNAVAHHPRQSEELRFRIARSVDDIRADVAKEAKSHGQPPAH